MNRSARTLHLLYRASGPLEALLDLFAWTAAASLAVYIRYDFHLTSTETRSLARFLPIVAIVQCSVGLAVGLYRKRWRYGSFDEVAALIVTAVVVTGILFAVDRYYLSPRFPLSAVLVGGSFGLVLMAGIRYVWRLVLERIRRPGSAAERILVYGAGEAAFPIISAMLRNPDSTYVPVGILDDDPAKRRLSIKGVRVLGSRVDLADVASATGAVLMLIAVPSADSELIGDLVARAVDAGMRVKVLPLMHELVGQPPDLRDIPDVSESDLLGRHQITTDLPAIAGYLNNRRVLVTGAGGSIGSELCRQISRFGPSELIMLDRDESALHGVELSIVGRALLDSPNLVLADLRDAATIKRILTERRPHVVFHAAALKHLPLLEQYPAEAVKSNVVGTLTLLEAAASAGVERFVNVSTDKAANPISALGYSKRIAERLTSHVASTASGTFLSVRFGNVLGSRGSMLGTFQTQIDAGGPVTVTDPDVTRYFMTVQEAVQLVVQAGAIGRPGEVLVLDMGAAVRIDDVARRLVRNSGRPVRIVYTGLRAGEKLHEELFGAGERDERPFHPQISQVEVPPLRLDPMEASTYDGDRDDVVAWMRELVQRDIPS